ncbi:hypothetical protein [Paenibacillus oleatilyticus]|uniref:hypothetical protein n=1 Tax=Paenibacillus oleatilyticus TaxID=2594886 RepID=UPI001C1F9978|nr:hypothetical protein [Paenibacillus oleatilyticus]MBU7320294.1 hypothetical protein [Paenibacillus oleatilyticus]
MIKVTGTVWLTVEFEAEIDMTEEEFDAMTEHDRTALLDQASKWRDTAKLDEIEVDEYEVNEIDEI